MNSYKQELRAAKRRGWQLKRQSKHYRLTWPGGGGPVFTSSTAGGGRAIANLRSHLKRVERQYPLEKQTPCPKTRTPRR